tara:strand:- start:165 stop:383 length:219 start_codon:yes stop_codon:yes gene_type:complete
MIKTKGVLIYSFHSFILPKQMKSYLFFIAGTLLFFWAFDSSLKKSTRIHCESGLIQSACEAVEARNKLIKEL